MRIMGIDYGEKRIGVAISDPLGITAQGLPTIERTNIQEDIQKNIEYNSWKRGERDCRWLTKTHE